MQSLLPPLQRISAAQSLSSSSVVLRPPTAMVTMAFSPSSLASSNASTNGTNAIVFAASGLKPDTRIKVFEQEFHVHSVVLKLHSAFFRKFIDVEDRVSSYSEIFRYDYISCVDVDGGWGLEVATEEARKFDGGILKERLGFENDEEAFRKVLCALYNRPYSIANFRELSDMTRIGDCFCMLPIVSASLYTALWQSPGLIDELPSNCKSTLILAQRLRHPLLFREAMVHVVSQWRGYSPFLAGHYSLICTVTASYNRVCERLLDVNQELFTAINLGSEQRDIICDATKDLDNSELATQNAHVYRKIYDIWAKTEDPALQDLRYQLKELLENKLVLDRRLFRAGEDDYKYVFLSAEVTDHELPWDPEELEW